MVSIRVQTDVACWNKAITFDYESDGEKSNDEDQKQVEPMEQKF